MTAVSAEQILVIPTAVFKQLGYFQGFTRDVEHYLEKLLNPNNLSYRPRAEMEQDPSFKQLIPYVIFRHKDSAGRVHVFEYTRGKGQGEARLHSKKSVGIGGHISLTDAGGEGQNPYEEGLRRELSEEVIIETEYTQRCVGLINDDETEVGRVHLGVVHIFDVRSPNVRPRESEIIDAGFRPLDSILDNLDGFETWSKICLESLFR